MDSVLQKESPVKDEAKGQDTLKTLNYLLELLGNTDKSHYPILDYYTQMKERLEEKKFKKNKTVSPLDTKFFLEFTITEKRNCREHENVYQLLVSYLSLKKFDEIFALKTLNYLFDSMCNAANIDEDYFDDFCGIYLSSIVSINSKYLKEVLNDLMSYNKKYAMKIIIDEELRKKFHRYETGCHMSNSRDFYLGCIKFDLNHERWSTNNSSVLEGICLKAFKELNNYDRDFVEEYIRAMESQERYEDCYKVLYEISDKNCFVRGGMHKILLKLKESGQSVESKIEENLKELKLINPFHYLVQFE